MATSDQDDDVTGLVETLKSLPLANDSFTAIRRRYSRVKRSHKFFAGTLGSIEHGIGTVGTLPLVKPSFAMMDKLAGSGLKRIRKSYPSLRTMSSHDLHTATQDYYKSSMLYRTTMSARNLSSAALNITRHYSLARLNEASQEVSRNFGDAVVAGRSAFISGIRFTMDTVTNTMDFFEFVVDRYFNTEAPIVVAESKRKKPVMRSQTMPAAFSHRPTFNLDDEEDKYEESDNTCKERFGKMQRKMSICIKRQPKSLSAHIIQQSWHDFTALLTYLLCSLWSCLRLFKYPILQSAEILLLSLKEIFMFSFKLTWAISEQLILRTIKLWTFAMALTSRQVNKSSSALPSPIRSPVQSTATYFEHLHESLAETRNLLDVRAELTAERSETRRMASAALSGVRRWTTNG